MKKVWSVIYSNKKIRLIFDFIDLTMSHYEDFHKRNKF